jgi:hypothetical protein
LRLLPLLLPAPVGGFGLAVEGTVRRCMMMDRVLGETTRKTKQR